MRVWGPLGLAAAEAQHRAAATVAVYPRHAPIRYLPHPRRTQTFVGNYVSPTQGEGIEPGDIRPFAPGDQVRHVNWRATLKLGPLHVTRHHQERNADVVLLLDTLSDVGPDGLTVVDAAVRGAAALAAAYLARKDRVGPDRVRRPAALGAAGRGPRPSRAPARYAAERVGRLHLRQSRPRSGAAAHPAAPGPGGGAEPAARPALRAGRDRPRRAGLRSPRHRGLAGSGGPRRDAPVRGRRRGGAPVGTGASRRARAVPSARGSASSSGTASRPSTRSWPPGAAGPGRRVLAG